MQIERNDSLDFEIKQRLEDWRMWAKGYVPGGLSRQNIVAGILDNTAQSRSGFQRPEEVNAECEETDSWINDMLNHSDTYLAGLAIYMRYTAHIDTPTSTLSKLFPKSYAWMNFKKNGGSFEDFRIEVKKSQNLKKNFKDDYDKPHVMKIEGVDPQTFLKTVMEGRYILAGRLLAKRSEFKREKSDAKIYSLNLAKR
jgi:hypothetical protein